LIFTSGCAYWKSTNAGSLVASPQTTMVDFGSCLTPVLDGDVLQPAKVARVRATAAGTTARLTHFERVCDSMGTLQ
jgi:hypothetical protein